MLFYGFTFIYKWAIITLQDNLKTIITLLIFAKLEI